MEVSRITFRKETKNKMKKGMSAFEKGKALYGRLQELERDGTLSQCRTRTEVVTCVGYSPDRVTKGRSWLNNLIKRGHVSEIELGHGEYRYMLGPKMPDYSSRIPKTVTKPMVEPDVNVLKQATEPVILSRAYDTENSVKILNTKITLKKGDKTIEIEGDRELVKEVIKMFMEG